MASQDIAQHDLVQDEYWMDLALQQAEAAFVQEEVPIGAVLVRHGQLIAQGHNLTRTQCDPTAHAEVVVLRDAAAKCGNYRLLDSTLYVTLEPCCMCVGAMVQGRIKRLVYGAPDPKAGAVASQFALLTPGVLNHHISVIKGVRDLAAVSLLQQFFKMRR